MGLVRFLQRRDLFAGEFDLDRGKQFLDVLDLGRADNRSGHPGRLQNPRTRYLRRRDTALARDPHRRVGDSEVRFAKVQIARDFVGPGPQRVAAAARAPVAGEKAARERTPRDDADALVDAERNHLALFLAVDQIVMVLHRDEAMPTPFAGHVERFAELPCRHAAGAEVAHLARAHQRVERLERFLDRSFEVPSVDLVEVDEIGLEPAQRRVAGLEDVLAAEPAAIGTRAHRTIDLGREHDLVARSHFAQPAAGYLFTDAGRVHVGSVEEIDPRLERGGKVLARLVAGDNPFTPSLVAIAHASEADARHAKT